LIWQLNDCWPVQSWALLDSSGAYKAAAFEVRRLYAPLLASLEQLEDSLRLWAILDNSVDGFSGPTAVEARCLTDGSLLGRWETLVDLAPGQRQVVLDIDLGRFHRASTIISAALDKSSTFRLLAEPRYAQFPTPPLVVTVSQDCLIIRSDAPIVDLHLWDEDGELFLLDDFVTLPAGGSITLRSKGHPSRLQARSLAGKHALEIIKS
jgi:beta-mannosidase